MFDTKDPRKRCKPIQLSLSSGPPMFIDPFRSHQELEKERKPPTKRTKEEEGRWRGGACQNLKRPVWDDIEIQNGLLGPRT